jgi:hypothetical protein
MNTQVGHCPKCGAPIYGYQGIWLGITPPPVTHSCNCNPQATQTTSSTSIIIQDSVARKHTHNIYTKEDIINMFDFMYSSRWKIGKDEYRKVGYALKVLLSKAEEVGLEEAMEYFNNMDSDSSEFPF